MQQKLRAKVREMTGRVTHSSAMLDQGKLIVSEMPRVEWLEISQEPGGVYLFRFDEFGNCIADTWHTTIDEARKQAGFEFGIREGDWEGK